MGSRNVLKWKWVEKDGQKKRNVRCRLALRVSQGILASEAACHPDWEFMTVDVNKAFLQGATYKELQELTGDAPREVCFTLPKGMAEMLRKLFGFEVYDERIRCIEHDKPGAGSKDAPRAFSES